MLTRKRQIGAFTVLLVAMAIAGTCFSFAARGQGQSANDTDDWEYLIVAGGRVSLSPGSGQGKQKIFQEAVTVERNLDQLGKEGWILVAVTGSQPEQPVFYLKRPVRSR